MNLKCVVNAEELERETGLGKDLLRKWRSRYGFPSPLNGAGGEYGYPREQVVQLRLIKRLQGAGYRPNQVVGKSRDELEQLLQAAAASLAEVDASPVTTAALEHLKDFDLPGLAALLQAERRQHGLTDFVTGVLAPLISGMGNAWSRGELEIYHEHACSAMLGSLLHAEIGRVTPPPGALRVLFATPSDERHGLGLLMAQAVLADAGAECINLGMHLPPAELLLAARAAQVAIVALSLSFAYPKWRVRPLLTQLREGLPLEVELWVGGAGAASIKRAPPGVRIFSDLHAAAGQLGRLADKAPAGAATRQG